MTKRITGRGLVIKDSQILLMERWRGALHYFSIPGGGVEPGETIEQAATREIYEETGVKATIKRKYITALSDDSEHHVFLCQYVSGEPHLRADSPEAIDHARGDNRFAPRWVDFSELSGLPFEYWQPLHGLLIEGAASGFANAEKTITF